MNKTEAFEIVLKELMNCPLFCGRYDAKNGNEHFMYGIYTVMEVIASYTNEMTKQNFVEMFSKNMDISIEKIKQD